ncbi:MAG: hypothetical protein FWF07_04125 [Methanomassiliicoccaceae archaeon]|nr:hypothetical protein [Methanomassiliicoccaceae archaeon]
MEDQKDMNEIHRLIGVFINYSQVVDNNLAYGIILNKAVSGYEKKSSSPIESQAEIKEEALPLRKKLSEMGIEDKFEFVSETEYYKKDVLTMLRKMAADREFIFYQMFKDQFEDVPPNSVIIKRYLYDAVSNATNLNKLLIVKNKSLNKQHDRYTERFKARD